MTDPARILLVDDDVELVGMLRDYLVQDGFEVLAVPDGEAGVAEALSGHYAIVVLDVMMPGMSGIEALRRIRADSAVPVLMLTARGDDLDRIVGLELGADDYVPKPCTPRELAARMRAILRRSQRRPAMPAPAPLVVGAAELWPGQRRAEWAGEAAGADQHRIQSAGGAGAQRRAAGQQEPSCPSRRWAGRWRVSTAASTCI